MPPSLCLATASGLLQGPVKGFSTFQVPKNLSKVSSQSLHQKTTFTQVPQSMMKRKGSGGLLTSWWKPPLLGLWRGVSSKMENTPSTEMFAFMYLYTANEISPSFVQSIVWFVRFDYLVHFPFPNGSTELYLFLLNRAVGRPISQAILANSSRCLPPRRSCE
jgi:hypothetical protein